MSLNSRQKGIRGELELRDFLRRFNIQARRGQQYAGGGDSPDVVTDLADLHFECKRVERTSIYEWMEQAKTDCKLGSIPVVAHRQNDKEWLAVLRLEDFIKIIQRRDPNV
jgi:hypothetical protein